MGYAPPPTEGKNTPFVVLPEPEVSVLTPKAASICCACAVLSKRANTKSRAIKVSFFKFFSKELLETWMWLRPAELDLCSTLRFRIIPCLLVTTTSQVQYIQSSVGMAPRKEGSRIVTNKIVTSVTNPVNVTNPQTATKVAQDVCRASLYDVITLVTRNRLAASPN